MRNHIITIILLLFAVIAFAMRSFVAEEWQNYCDIAAFVLPTCAAVVEMILTEKSAKATEEKIQDIEGHQLWIDVDEENEGLIIKEGIK